MQGTDLTSEVPNPPRIRSGCWKWLALIVIASAFIGGLLVWKLTDESLGLLSSIGRWFKDEAVTRSVEETFRERITRVRSNEGDVLEVATVETEETFTRLDSRDLFSGWIPLGTTLSEIRVPVVYRYHVLLSDPWNVEVTGDQISVTAPVIRPSLPPAIRTDGMQKKSTAGWARFNAADNLSHLERELTPRMERRAAEARRVNLSRDAAREAVEKFVRRWILDSHPEHEQAKVEILFADEKRTPPVSQPKPKLP